MVRSSGLTPGYSMKASLAEIVDLTGGKLVRGDERTTIDGFASLDDAFGQQITFYVGERFLESLKSTRAAAVLVESADVPAPESVALVIVENAAAAFDAIVERYADRPPEFVPGRAEGSHVDASAVFDDSRVSIQPGAVVLGAVRIGAGTRIQAGAVLGERVQIGEDCDIGPNVTIREGCILGDRVTIHAGSVVGADGFGYEFEEGRHRKVEQLGIVRIENDVEIGAGTTIDRARFGETVIGEGTKIDNLVQIGHNVVIGKHCIIVAQTGISGSARIGNYVTLAARVGVAGHIEIADRVTVGGKSGVIASIKEPGGTYFGYPAKPMKESLRTRMHLKQLGGLIRRFGELEKRMEALDGKE